MMRVAAVIDRLSETLVPDTFKVVSGLAAMPDRLDQVKWANVAFVIPKGDRVGRNEAGTAVIDQRCERVVAVLIGFTRQSQRKMGNLDSIEDVVEAVKAALIGWVPAGEQAPVTYAGGGVGEQDLANGIVVWGCDFACPYYLEV